MIRRTRSVITYKYIYEAINAIKNLCILLVLVVLVVPPCYIWCVWGVCARPSHDVIAEDWLSFLSFLEIITTQEESILYTNPTKPPDKIEWRSGITILFMQNIGHSSVLIILQYDECSALSCILWKSGGPSFTPCTSSRNEGSLWILLGMSCRMDTYLWMLLY